MAMTATPMMACGHAANAVCHGIGNADPAGHPSCVICAPKDEACAIAAGIDLTGRVAVCAYYPRGGRYHKCPEPVPSSTALAFFEHKPGEARDRYYCGCFGWD